MDGHSSTYSYKYVEPLLKDDSNELLVISPYIGHGYAKMLVELGRRKKVKVVTSGTEGWLEGYTNKYSRHMLFKYLKALAGIAIVAIALAYIRLYLFSGIALLFFILISIIAYFKFTSTKSSDINVKVVRSTFIHEKIYISGTRAVIGSANLTYQGMHKNLEHVELVTDLEKILELREHFDEVWKKY